MTTPAGITVSVATDKKSYAPGEAIEVTVTYTDTTTVTDQLTVTARVTDASGVSAEGSAAVSVVTSQQAADTVAVSDSWGSSYTQASAVPGTAVFTSVVGTGPVAPPAPAPATPAADEAPDQPAAG